MFRFVIFRHGDKTSLTPSQFFWFRIASYFLSKTVVSFFNKLREWGPVSTLKCTICVHLLALMLLQSKSFFYSDQLLKEVKKSCRFWFLFAGPLLARHQVRQQKFLFWVLWGFFRRLLFFADWLFRRIYKFAAQISVNQLFLQGRNMLTDVFYI